MSMWLGLRGLGYGQQPLGYGLDDLLVDFVDGEVTLDEDDAGWFAGGGGRETPYKRLFWAPVAGERWRIDWPKTNRGG